MATRQQQDDPEPMDRRDFLKSGVACAAGLAALGAGIAEVQAQTARRGLLGRRPSPWFRSLAGQDLECTLCPWHCRLSPGRRGRCRVRQNSNGRGETLVYGNPCLVQLDPVERKPFFHVRPGSRALSVATAGCPLACRFCEVWDMALTEPEQLHAYELPPGSLVEQARAVGAVAMSYAFGEPVAFYEYMADTAVLARQAGLLNLMHTSAFIEPEPLRALAGLIDAANIDLKSLDAQFYRDMCGGELAPVLAAIKLLAGTGMHLEITTILIPGANDSPQQVSRLCHWIRDELGVDVPVHFARFYPLYKLANLPPTPVAVLDRARKQALDAGLHYVYVSRVTGHPGQHSYCPTCGKTVIERLGFMIEALHIRNGRCEFCATALPGLWA